MESDTMDRKVIATVVAIFLLTLTTGCISDDSDPIEGSGDLLDIDYDYRGFTKVEFGMGFRLTITQSTNYSIELSIDDNLEEYLTVRMDGDWLIVTLEDGQSYVDETLNAVITMPDLEYLIAHGGALANVKNFTLDHTLNIKADEGASVIMNGSGEDLTIEGTGGAHVDCWHFESVNTDVELDGGAFAIVNTSGSLKGSVDGGAHLRYYGEPSELSVSEDGGATVIKVG